MPSIFPLKGSQKGPNRHPAEQTSHEDPILLLSRNAVHNLACRSWAVGSDTGTRMFGQVSGDPRRV